MANKENKVLTTSQATLMIVGSMIGIGILSLPANLTKVAENDGWLGIFVGSTYLFYMVACASLIFKNNQHGDTNIIQISQNYFGKFFGNLLSIIFTFQFLAYIIITSANISNMLRVYLILFLEQYKIAIPILMISIYTSAKGIKGLGKINEIIFYLSIPLVVLTGLALKHGSILNIKPLFSNSITSILRAGIEPVYSFVGIESMFFIIPLMKEKNKAKSCLLRGVFIIVFTYAWFAFITIYYLGCDVTKNLYWPTLSIVESISIPGISNFKFVFMFLWSSIIFKTIANQSYFFCYSLSNILKKLKPNVIYLIVFIFSSIVVSKLDSFILMKRINKGISLFYAIFNIIFITTITIITVIKNGGKNKKNDEVVKRK